MQIATSFALNFSSDLQSGMSQVITALMHLAQTNNLNFQQAIDQAAEAYLDQTEGN